MKKALIVDDEENARLYLANILHELYPEIEIQMVASPVEAIFMISKQCPDVILLDVEMPGMTGLEMLKQLRETIKETPVIFVSTYKRAEFIQNAMRLNAIDYIDKPVDPAELNAAMAKSLCRPAVVEPQITSTKLILYTEKGDLIIEPNEIIYFESHKRDSIVYLENGLSKVVVRSNLSSLEKLLPGNIFIRVSRQFIINKRFVKFSSQSNHTLTLYDGCEKIILNRIFPEVFKNQVLK